MLGDQDRFIVTVQFLDDPGSVTFEIGNQFNLHK